MDAESLTLFGNIFIRFSIRSVLWLAVLQVTLAQVPPENATDAERFLLIRWSSAFVDKTWLLKRIFQYASILLTAPQHFGKSMNLQMVRMFLDANNNRSGAVGVFRNTNIVRDREFVMEHFCKYPVLFCSFKPGTAVNNFNDVRRELRNSVAHAFIQHEYLLESPKLDNETKQMFLEYMTSRVSGFELGLKVLSEALFLHCGKKVILLIDDYDFCLTESLFRKDLDSGKIARLIFRLVDNAVNLNEFSERAVLMGRVSYNLGMEYSGVDLLQHFKFMESEDFAPFFGFTSRETEGLLGKFGLGSLSENVSQWYGGYSHARGGFHVHNPLSVLRFMKTREFNVHWLSARRRQMFLDYMETYYQLREFIARLVKREEVAVPIVAGLTIYDVEKLKSEILPARFSHEEDFAEFYLFLQVLLESGYLTFAEEHTDSPATTKVKFPNLEVQKVFEQILKVLSASYDDT